MREREYTVGVRGKYKKYGTKTEKDSGKLNCKEDLRNHPKSSVTVGTDGSVPNKSHGVRDLSPGFRSVGWS